MGFSRQEYWSGLPFPSPGDLPNPGIEPTSLTSLALAGGSLVAQTVKNVHGMQETWVGKIPWRRAWQSTLVFLSGESPWIEESGGLQSMGSQKVGHN